MNCSRTSLGSLAIAPPDPIVIIYNLYKREIQKKGKSVSIIKAQKFENTYPYRHLKKFYDKMEKDEFSHTQIQEAVRIMIEYAAENSLLYKGTTIFLQSNLIEIIYSKIKDQITNDDLILSNIAKSHELIEGKDLLQKERIGGLCNLLKWYYNNEISEIYIAFSLKCLKAINKLNFPISLVSLLALRMKYSHLSIEIKNLLNNDFCEKTLRRKK